MSGMSCALSREQPTGLHTPTGGRVCDGVSWLSRRRATCPLEISRIIGRLRIQYKFHKVCIFSMRVIFSGSGEWLAWEHDLTHDKRAAANRKRITIMTCKCHLSSLGHVSNGNHLPALPLHMLKHVNVEISEIYPSINYVWSSDSDSPLGIAWPLRHFRKLRARIFINHSAILNTT